MFPTVNTRNVKFEINFGKTVKGEEKVRRIPFTVSSGSAIRSSQDFSRLSFNGMNWTADLIVSSSLVQGGHHSALHFSD